jgi:hypothetical protein
MAVDELTTVDELTRGIDKLWISSLRNFKPTDIQYRGVSAIRRDTTLPLSEICKKLDSREYVVVPDNKEVYLDYEILGGWAGNGYQNSFDGYDSERYLAFKNGCLGKEAPKNPTALSFEEANKLYGDLNIERQYQGIKEAYDLGVQAAQKWPEFLVLAKEK